VTKPFDLRELLARCKAVLRRTAGAAGAKEAAPAHAAGTTIAFEDWRLDTAARSLVGRSGSVELTGGEFDLLLAFVSHPGRVLSRDFLLGQTRGREAGPFDRTIDVQVGRLRRKLEDDPDKPRLIKSVRGAGYLFVAPVRTV
jgi:two-component system OmpR family response regulator